jgi:hypothetical protein
MTPSEAGRGFDPSGLSEVYPNIIKIIKKLLKKRETEGFSKGPGRTKYYRDETRQKYLINVNLVHMRNQIFRENK